MKDLLRQKLDSIAGKVLAGSPLRQSSTGSGTGEGWKSTGRGREDTHGECTGKEDKAEGILEEAFEESGEDHINEDELGRHSRLKVIVKHLSYGNELSLSAEGVAKNTNESLHPPIYNLYTNQFVGMQDIRMRVERPTYGSPSHQPSTHLQHQQAKNAQQPPPQSQLNNNQELSHHSPPHPRPMHLFTNPNINCDNHLKQPPNNQQHHQQNKNHYHTQLPHQLLLQHHHNNIHSRSPSSEEDNSPTEMNNCRRLIEKPPLVKRLTMGLLRPTEDSRPLVHNNTSSPNSGSMHTISDGYVNEGICDPDLKLITSKFGDSCRKSLTSVMDKAQLEPSCEFDFKKNVLRETSSANSSPKIVVPSAPRFESAEYPDLMGAPWFQAGLPREISLEVLARQNPGAFLVRQSSTKPDCFALSLRVPPPAPKVAHYLILKTSRGFKIKGFTKEFSSLRALITHHSVMPELLPVPLALPRPQNIIPQRRHLDDFDTYGSLNDFRKMMSDLNV